jgi:lactoylglutathione lyase
MNKLKIMKRLFVLLFFILFFNSAIGQDNIEYSFSFDHIALSVKDVDSSVDFYKNVLGIKEITNRTKIEGIRWLTLSDGTELHLISIIKDSFTLNKAIHLGLSTSNFDTFIKRLDILKIDYSDWPGTPHKVNIRTDGIKQIYFQDLDGYWIEVNNVEQKN